MKMAATFLTAVAAILSVAPASPQDGVNPRAKEQIEASAQRIKDLQKERIAVLERVVEQLNALAQRAQAEPGEVMEATLLLFQARLDAAEKMADRVTLYKNLANLLKQYEEAAHQRAQAARGTEAALLKIRAKRLEAEIHLEQAQLNGPELSRQKIVVTNPKAKDVTVTRQFVGHIHAWRHIEVRSLQSGYIEEIPVKEGQRVKRGDELFRLTPILYKAKLDAEMAEAKVAELHLNNAERLFQDKVVNQIEVAQFQAKLAKAQAKVKLAEAELNHTVVKAPFDGIIDRLHKQQGSLIAEGNVFTTLSDNSLIWVYFNVPEALYLEYMTGAAKENEGKIELKLANGKTFSHLGKFGAIEADFNSESGNIPFRADFPNPDHLLRHRMTGTVSIQHSLKGAIVVPQRATFEILDKRYVYVVDEDDIVHQREIVIQHEVADTFVINKGVGVDDRIIIDGIRQVRDGEKVTFEIHSPN